MNRLLKLLALNKDKATPFKAETDGDEATIFIYDAITSDDYWGGVTAENFVRTLNSISAPVIHLRINSPGGDVFAARSMVQAIREHKSKIVAHIDGYAASAATFLVVASDESYISDGGMFMIHNAWTIAMGNSQDFLDTAELLEKIDETLRQDYAKKTGADIDQIREWMDAETYLFGQEAVDAGFVDAIAEAAPKNKIHWDLSAYDHAPASSKVAPEEDPEPEPEPAPAATDLTLQYKQLEVVRLTA